MLAHGLDEWKLRDGKGRGDAGLLKEHHAVTCADHPAIADPVGSAQARPEVAPMQLTRRVGKAQDLGVQVEDRSLVVFLRRGKIHRVARAHVQRQPPGYLPVVADEELGDVRAGLNYVLLNV